jgi:hypothetical protein
MVANPSVSPIRLLLIGKQGAGFVRNNGPEMLNSAGYTETPMGCLVGVASILFGYADSTLCRVLPRCVCLHRFFALCSDVSRYI